MERTNANQLRLTLAKAEIESIEEKLEENFNRVNSLIQQAESSESGYSQKVILCRAIDEISKQNGILRSRMSEILNSAINAQNGSSAHDLRVMSCINKTFEGIKNDHPNSQTQTQKRIEDGTDKAHRHLLGRRADRKAALKLVNNPAQMFEELKRLRNAAISRTEDEQDAIEEAFLKEFATDNTGGGGGGGGGGGAKTRRSKKGSKKRGKRRGKRTKKAQRKTKSSSLTQMSEKVSLDLGAAAAPAISPLQALVTKAFSADTPVTIKKHRRVARWDRDSLQTRHVATWPKYVGRTEEELEENIILHAGDGTERILNCPELRRDYVWEREQGPLMWCSIHLHDKSKKPIFVKLQFGIGNTIYHRMSTRARRGNVQNFLAMDPVEQAPAVEADDVENLGEETIAGRYSVVALSGGSIEITYAKHSFIKSLVVHRFS